MRDDHQGAAAALRLLAKAILSVPSTDKRRMRAYLVRVGRMFRDNAIVRAAILELRRREENDETMFAEREQRIVQPASAAFQRLAESLSPSGPIQETTLQAAQQATSLPGRKIAPVALGEMLKEARNWRLPDITLPDLPILSKAVERLLIDLRGFVDRDPAVDASIREMEKVLSSGKLADAALETQGLLGYLSIGRNVDILLNHAAAWDAALRGESFSPPPTQAILYQEGLEQEALVLMDQIIEQLELRTARRFVLFRLRLWLEQFECERLRSELGEAEATRKPREAILQREMDRFLFQEGYFPLTHAGASRGFADTAILGRIEEAGVPPILVELKQVTAFERPSEASRHAIESAIGTARGEVQRYRGAIESRPQWSGVVPFIVVVHTCDEDVSDLESNDVVLIDLSTTTPSRKRARR